MLSLCSVSTVNFKLPSNVLKEANNKGKSGLT